MTQRVWDETGFEMTTTSRPSRIETPSMAGLHHGVKSCSLIGRKLNAIFEVPTSTSGAIEALLRELERKTAN